MFRAADAETDVGNSPKRRLTTIVAADICGYSKICEADPEAAARLVEVLYAAFQEAVAKHRGRIFNRAGDSFLAEFRSPRSGMAAALDFLNIVKGEDAVALNGVSAAARLGVHVGEVIDQADGDMLGPGVNVAARLQSEARPNGVLISIHTFNHVGRRFAGRVDFRRRGPLALKNIDEPVVAFDAFPGKANAAQALAQFISMPKTWARRALTVIFLVCFLATNLAAATIILLNNSADRRSPEQGFEAAASAEFGANPRTELTSLISIADVKRSLLQSAVPGKPEIGEKLFTEPLATSLRRLKAIREDQRAANVPQNELDRTLREIGALAYFVDTASATQVYEEILETHPKDPLINYQLGELYNQRQSLEKANRHFRRARLYSRPHEKTYIAATIGLGRAILQEGDIESSRAFLEEGHTAALNHQYINEATLAKLKLGGAHLIASSRDASFDFSPAKRHLKKALDFARDFAVPVYEAEALNLLGRIATLEAEAPSAANRKREDLLAAARSDLTESIRLSKANSDQRGLASALNNLGELDFLSGAPERARALFEEAYKISIAGGLPSLAALTRKNMAHALYAKEDYESACATYADAFALYRKIPREISSEDAARLAEVCPTT